MEVITAKTAGFCFGVKRAVDTVHTELNKNTEVPIYTFGPIIHNEQVVEELGKRGVKVLDSVEDAAKERPGVVIIRAHGVPEDVYEALKTAGHKVIDATCPFVLKIHKAVKNAMANGEFVIIVGDARHPEVQGIQSCVKNNSVVIANREQAELFMENEAKKHSKLCVVAQTTFNFNKFKELVEIFCKNSYDSVSVLNTICNATEERQKEAAMISSSADAMIVIGSNSSSNSQKLYDICSNLCDNTFFIQNADDMDFERIRDSGRIGITAGASTPNKLIQEVQTLCQNLNSY